jgi:hypothetical protein
LDPTNAGAIKTNSSLGESVTIGWNSTYAGEVDIVVRAMYSGTKMSDPEEFTIQVDECLGINDQKESFVRIYPNPVRDKVFIETDLNRELQVKFFDTVGNLLIVKKFNKVSKGYIDVTFLSEGIYFMQIIGERSEKITKLIIE